MLTNLDPANIPADAEVWEKVIRKVRTGMMPPIGVRHPDPKTRATFVSQLSTTLDRAAAAKPNPGRPALYRLNRTEYANAIRDLLDLEVDASTLLPPDDSAYGFDNVADVLGISSTLMQQYVNAAGKVGVTRRRQPRRQPRLAGVQPPAGRVAGSAHRGSAVRHRRRAAGPAGDSGRRRLHAVGEVLPHQSRRDARPRVRALHGVLGGRQARPPLQGRRRRRLGREPREQHGDRRPDRRAVAHQGAADAWARTTSRVAWLDRGAVTDPYRVSSTDAQLARPARSAWHSAHADVHRHRPVQPRRQRRHAEPAADLRLHARRERDAAGRGGVRHAHPVRARPPRLPRPGHRRRYAAADDVLPRGAPARADFEAGDRGRPAAHPGQPEVHLPRRARSADGEGRRGLRAHRLRAGVASGLLPLEQHSRRSTAAGGQPGTPAGARRARAPGQADAGRPEGRAAEHQFRRPVAVPAQPEDAAAELDGVPGLRRQPARRPRARGVDVLRQHPASRIATSWT